MGSSKLQNSQMKRSKMNNSQIQGSQIKSSKIQGSQIGGNREVTKSLTAFPMDEDPFPSAGESGNPYE